MLFHHLSNTQKSYIFIVLGVILLLHSVGIFKQAFNFVIVVSGLFLLFYGFVLGDFWTKIKAVVHRYKK